MCDYRVVVHTAYRRSVLIPRVLCYRTMMVTMVLLYMYLLRKISDALSKNKFMMDELIVFETQSYIMRLCLLRQLHHNTCTKCKYSEKLGRNVRPLHFLF